MLSRAAVVGSPVAHSLSPVLHRAAYAELGLTDWSYDRIEIDAADLPEVVAGLGPEWVGLSVTMPGKEVALTLAQGEVSVEATLSGAANTLYRTPQGWAADNTDVRGLVVALEEAGVRAFERGVVVGGGATARSAVVALSALGMREVTFCLRGELRGRTRELLEATGIEADVVPLAHGIPLGAGEVVVSTLPGHVPSPVVRAPLDGGPSPVVMDVSYEPWPSALATAVASATGGRVQVVRGTRMLLHQAVRQVEVMTGRPGPTAAMDRALTEHLAARGAS
ncbi:Shikimate 5-dehydrogenase I alpha [Serinicoccus hydrothermalis]|uniref:Shikimate 5-dehydrogenase I alpha n=1 Tax=Serinicoccus hydrothermalis TaxID=1758689 RepID=A0A1B1N820_9MICO|nr:shikimate dehydrogenase [Serinicoccus hydrothermalis]ANS77577.1 Shikimate 5-dehydrogenase I alpha [Serinicoccus hydrothermalis]